ncbi:MAG: hypothetical protein WKF68_10450 [Daejeonella sp.]
MEKIYRNFPADKEAAIFYALALAPSAEQTDKTFKNQKKAYRSAKAELSLLRGSYDTLIKQGELYQASQVQNQVKSSEAWILFKEGKDEEALETMKIPADMEDKTEKHPVTPAEVLPARELLG